MSPLGFTIGLLPPSAVVIGAPSFKFCTVRRWGEEEVSVAREEDGAETGSMSTQKQRVFR